MRLRGRVLDGMLGATGLLALGTSFLVIDRELDLGVLDGLRQPAFPSITDWESLAKTGYRVGPRNAAVSIVVFSDYQCAFCEVLDRTLRTILERHPADVQVIHRHFPLRVASKEAAMAAECAGAQGQFLAFHRLLFSKRDSLGVLPWRAFGEQASVPDLGGLESCVETGAFADRLQADWEAARRLGGRGTPLLLVNEKLLHGAPPKTVLEELVQEALGDRPMSGS